MPFEVVGNCDFDGVAAKALVPLSGALTLSVQADKDTYHPGEVSRISASISNGHLPHNLMLYIVLERPDGGLRFLIRPIDTPPNPPCSLWTHLGRFLMLSKGFWLEAQGGLQLREMPPGRYTLYAFLTEPNTTEVVAKATSTFLLLSQAAGVQREAF
jgi:hypothetical protein